MQVNGRCGHLSDRRMNYGQATVHRNEAGDIVINAGDGNDQIHVRRANGGRVHVVVNSQSFEFTAADLRGNLVLRGGRGRNRINIGSGLNNLGIIVSNADVVTSASPYTSMDLSP